MATKRVATLQPSCMNTMTFLLTFLVFISCTQSTLSTSTTDCSTNTYKKFIKTSCNSTTYPSICYKSLTNYASIIKTSSTKLSFASLAVTQKEARRVSSMLHDMQKQRKLTPIETAIVQDCVEEVDDSFDELDQAMKAFRKLNGTDAEYQMGNIKTWVSAALTDEYTCSDEFEEQEVSSYVKNKITKSITNLSRHTSNSLALVNNLKY